VEETLWSWLLIAAGATVVLYAAFVVGLVVAGRGADARALAGFVPDCVILFRRVIADERAPRRSRLVLGAMLAYLAMPFDLVPDVIPVAGQLDDLLVVVLVLRWVLRASGPELLREHWPGPPASMNALLALAHRRGPAARTRRTP
jgi:uncharacterized membrane protein YkvA (DUF1232 family)